MFSAGYNYSCTSNPKVWLVVSKDGADVGKMTFELYANHCPNLAANFAAFCNASATENRSFAGTGFNTGLEGYAINGGCLGDPNNIGAGDSRVADENLDLRHHKRGMLTMRNSGPNSNGSKFAVLFDEAHYLDGYN